MSCRHRICRVERHDVCARSFESFAVAGVRNLVEPVRAGKSQRDARSHGQRDLKRAASSEPPVASPAE